MQDGSEVNVDEVTSLFENSKILANVIKMFSLMHAGYYEVNLVMTTP